MDHDWLFRNHPDDHSCEIDGHALGVIYDRPWRSLWRKRYILKCFRVGCDVVIREPMWYEEPPAGTGIMAVPR